MPTCDLAFTGIESINSAYGSLLLRLALAGEPVNPSGQKSVFCSESCLAIAKAKEARTVFVSEKLQKELQQYAKVYKPANPNKKFFYSQKNASDGFSANTLTQFFHYLYKRAGLANCSSHSGRRTFATEIANKGVGIRVLQKLLGHKNIQTTAIYVDANDDMLRKAVNLA